jgi:hypothetical protein
MSNLGQAALIVVGTVVGAYFGNPQLGFVLGGLAGSALFPTQLPAGPKLTDNRTTTATVGTPVPILFGTADLAGSVIWLDALIQHSSEQGGKGGPQQQVFSYTQSIAIGLCERVDDFAAADLGAISGLTRIWENGQLVYDIRPQLAANTALGQLAETDAQYANRLAISAAYAETFTLYLGSEVQDPDPTIEAVLGIGNAPGFRGLAYIVFPNRQLQEGQGLRHPNWTFECYQAGTGECSESQEISNDILPPWGSGTGDVRGSGSYVYQIVAVDTVWVTGEPSDFFTKQYLSLEDALAAAAAYYPVGMNIFQGYSILSGAETTGAFVTNPTSSFDPTSPTTSGSKASPDPYVLGYNYNYRVVTQWFSNGNQQQDPGSHSGSLYRIPDHAWWEVSKIVYNTSVLGDSNPFAYPPWDSPFTGGSRWTGYYWFESVHDIQIGVVRVGSAPPDPCADLPPSLLPGFCIRGDGKLVKGGAWVKDSVNSYLALQGFAHQTAPFTNDVVYPLNPTIAVSDPNNNATFWNAAYAAAVAAGEMNAGMTYNSAGTGSPLTTYPRLLSYAWTIDMTICEGSGAEVNVGAIITAICKRAGLAEASIDVSDLTAIFVPGYTISGICDAADIISPLRSLAFFDCIESGSVLRFPARGKEIVATLTEDQIGCYDGDAFSNPSSIPPKVAVTRQDETTLPRAIRLHYKAVARDYQDGEEDSPFRLATTAIDDQDISIPICIGDTQALQAAEILWSDAWASQNSYVISIDQSLLALECGDCIGVPVDGFIVRMRIVSESNASGVLRKLTLVGDDQGSYISFREAAPPSFQQPTLSQLQQSIAILLNVPALNDLDNDAGFYAVAYPDPSTGNVWRGAQLYQSVDGINFSPSVFIPTAATVGTIDTAIPESESNDFDEYTVITVNCDASQSFVSRTDEAVLAGANAAAMGADGRWEIIQFCNAEQITPTQWQLSRLLRGRRGTEHVMGSSEAGDTFVMVSTGDIVRVPLSVAQIGAIYDYRIVSSGAAFTTGTDQNFISRGTALIPFSPVDAAAAEGTGGNIDITWTRRDRLGQTLMSGMDIPLSDYPENFEIDITEGPHSPASPLTVFRTLTSGTTSVVYSAADFAADYAGESPASPKVIYVRIYQMSLTMGRGTPEIATLVVS